MTPVVLPDGCTVFAEEIDAIEFNHEAGIVRARMKSGVAHGWPFDETVELASAIVRIVRDSFAVS